jgi:chorismate mutase
MSDSQRLRFILDGDDRLSRVLNHAGDSSARLHRRLNDDMDGNSRAVDGFFRSADGRLRDLRGRFLSADDAARVMGDGLPNLNRRLGDFSNAASSAGESGMGLMGALKGVGIVAGFSLLPAIGALVPLLLGAGAAAGTLKLGFSGVGDALQAQGKGAKEYKDALKKLSPEAQTFTKALVGLKGEFGPIGKAIQKSMLPGFTAAVKAAGPVVRILGKSMTEMGRDFGDAGQGVAKLLKDSGFQDDLQKNLHMGVGAIKDITAAVGPFVRSLLDLGAASGPTLKALTGGLSDLLSKGLPSLFDGLKQGIPGAAKLLSGLFSGVNDLLGGIGRLSGVAGKVLGPLFGDTFKVTGSVAAGAMDALGMELTKLEPVFRDVGFGLKAIMDVGRIIGPTLADTGTAIAGAFAPVGDSVNGAVGPLQRLDRWVKNNKVDVLEAARLFGVSFIDMTSASVKAAPQIIHAFRLVSEGVLYALDGMVSGAAQAFGWVPGIGSKLKAANRAFDSFKDGYLGALSTAERKANEFADSTVPRLSQGKLQLNINNWTSQIEAAKAKMKTLPASKQAALKATIADLEAKVRAAKGQLASLHDKNVSVTTTFYSVGSKASGGIPVAHRNYASGGTPKAGQLAMVGERGPEMVVFGQDARVFTAEETKGILRGSAGPRTIGAGVAAAQGLAAGMAGSTGVVGAAARAMAAAVTAGVRDELEIRSPSRKMKALMADVGKGIIIGLTGSRAKIKSTAADLARDIRTAFSGRKESRLLRYVDQQTKRLLDAAAKRDKIAAKIAEAKQYASTLTTNARSAAGLSNLGMDPDHVTAKGIKTGLQQKLAQIQQFTRYIGILAKRGLNKALLRQIEDMGPVDGYAYASALVGADKATFSSINKTETAINKTTASLGRQGADILYDSGKNASKGFLAGLQSQQAAIEKLMEKIARGMQKALRRALGIASPAKKMIPDGVNVMRGVAVGVLQGLPHIDNAMAAAAGRMTGALPAAGRPAVAGAGGGTVINVQVDVHDAMDPVAVGRELQRVLLQFGRVQGGAVTLKVGG